MINKKDNRRLVMLTTVTILWLLVGGLGWWFVTNETKKPAQFVAGPVTVPDMLPLDQMVDAPASVEQLQGAPLEEEEDATNNPNDSASLQGSSAVQLR